MLSRRDTLATILAAGALLPVDTFAASKAEKFTFPKGFIWGAATSGHQVEGNDVNSDMWLLENIKPSPFKEPVGDAVDHYHLFENDIKMLAGFGLNAYRFSLEWSRIEPEKGAFSAAEMNHYVDIAKCCLKYGIKPIVTYNHYAVPRWFAAQGGFENPESVELYARFCTYATNAMGQYIAAAATFNEPQIGIILKWILPPFIINDMFAAMKTAAKASASDSFSSMQFGNQEKILPNLLEAHRRGYAAIKAGAGDFPVGVTLAMMDDQAVGANSRRDEKRRLCYEPWLEVAKTHADFVGVQNYTRNLIDDKGVMPPPKGAILSATGEEFYPESLGNSIRYAYEQTKKPIYVTENGFSTDDDTLRQKYIPLAVKSVAGCIKEGIPVKSYIHWSLIDNFEWVWGYGPRMGLIGVDRKTQKRTPKPSATILGNIAKQNAI